MDLLSGLTWNVRGRNNIITRRNIKSLIKDNNINFLCLQETKFQAWDRAKKMLIWDVDTHDWLSAPANDHSGDLLTTWDDNAFTHINQISSQITGSFSKVVQK